MRAPVKRGRATGTRWTPPDKEWLELHYLTLKKSAIDISYEIGASPGGNTVLGWLQRLGITSRTPSQAQHLVKLGSKNPNWKGGRSPGTGKRAFRRRGDLRVCALCGSGEHLDIHHLDGDVTNNALENLEYRCHKCHLRGHRRGKLTEAEVAEIKELYAAGELRQWELANRFGVAQPTISDVITGRSWS